MKHTCPDCDGYGTHHRIVFNIRVDSTCSGSEKNYSKWKDNLCVTCGTKGYLVEQNKEIEPKPETKPQKPTSKNKCFSCEGHGFHYKRLYYRTPEWKEADNGWPTEPCGHCAGTGDEEGEPMFWFSTHKDEGYIDEAYFRGVGCSS